MKRKDNLPLNIRYETVFFKIDDFTKQSKVEVNIKSVTNKKFLLYIVDYIPLFEENEYAKLLAYYENSPLYVQLYNLMSFNYFTFYSQCICWYSEIIKIKGATNLNEIIEKYKTKISNDYSCPITKYLDLKSLDNLNLYKNFKSLMKISTIQNIKSVNVLLYGKGRPQIKKQPTPEGKELLNSVINIVYERFYIFLLQQDKTKVKTNKPTCLNDLYGQETTKIRTIREALKDLHITKNNSERQITGFIDGCKKANALPQLNSTDLMKIIYSEINKEYRAGTKPRYDKETYITSFKSTKDYFGIK